MQREKMDGANLREGIMEVALEQWTQTADRPSRIQRFSRVTGKRYRTERNVSCLRQMQTDESRTGRVQREFSEYRW